MPGDLSLSRPWGILNPDSLSAWPESGNPTVQHCTDNHIQHWMEPVLTAFWASVIINSFLFPCLCTLTSQQSLIISHSSVLIVFQIRSQSPSFPQLCSANQNLLLNSSHYMTPISYIASSLTLSSNIIAQTSKYDKAIRNWIQKLETLKHFWTLIIACSPSYQ